MKPKNQRKIGKWATKSSEINTNVVHLRTEYVQNTGSNCTSNSLQNTVKITYLNLICNEMYF